MPVACLRRNTMFKLQSQLLQLRLLTYIFAMMGRQTFGQICVFQMSCPMTHTKDDAIFCERASNTVLSVLSEIFCV